MLGSLGRLYTLGAEIDWRKLYPDGATAIKLPDLSVPGGAFIGANPNRTVASAWAVRLHPLLGIRIEVPKPSWNVELGYGELGLSGDHRIGDVDRLSRRRICRDGARRGPRDIRTGSLRRRGYRIPKIPVVDQCATPLAQVVYDPVSSEFDIYSRGDSSDTAWDLHAHGCVRQSTRPAPDRVDLAAIRQRCPESFRHEECIRRFAECGYHYGPTFQGMAQLWRGEREVLAEIETPSGISASIYPTIDCTPPFSMLAFKPCCRPYRPGPTGRA